jgi:hypothetical protein
VKAYAISTKWTGKGPHSLTLSAESQSILGSPTRSLESLLQKGGLNSAQLDFCRAEKRTIRSGAQHVGWGKQMRTPNSFILGIYLLAALLSARAQPQSRPMFTTGKFCK